MNKLSLFFIWLALPFPTFGAPAKEIKLTQEQRASSLFRMEKFTKQTMNVHVEVLGAIASDTDEVVQIHPNSPGTITKIFVAVGDTVEKGESLLEYQLEGNPPQFQTSTSLKKMSVESRKPKK